VPSWQLRLSLGMPTLAHFSSALAPVISAVHTDTFPVALGALLSSLVKADDVSLLRYREGHLPEVEYSSPPIEGQATTLDTYLTGPFLLDPFYRAAAMEQQYGVFHLRELAPAGFTDSEYYKTWYKSCGFKDECGLLIALDDGFVNIALGLTAASKKATPKFYKAHLALLQDIFPVVSSLARTHWQTSPQHKNGSHLLREQLHSSLAAFGSSVLTRREQQVTELVLLGNSTRLIAEKLGISTETVKLHRKHAYAKLDVSSQAELFLLFMEALAYSPDSGGIDPLIAYHSKPAK